MGDAEFSHSRNKIDTSGRAIRHAVRAGEEPPQDCLELVDEFRVWHVPTVRWIQSDLVGYFHDAVQMPKEVLPITSRLKTSPAIVAKLCRSSTALSRMQDLAGARIVVPSLRVQDVVSEVLTNGLGEAVLDMKDQRDEPDRYGYRAIHVVGFRDDRHFEVQVRTFNQDRWAQVVERIDSNFGYDLKHGQGPADWLQWLHELSDELRKADLGELYEIPKTPLDVDVDVDVDAE